MKRNITVYKSAQAKSINADKKILAGALNEDARHYQASNLTNEITKPRSNIYENSDCR
jgi:hypothetical protein